MLHTAVESVHGGGSNRRPCEMPPTPTGPPGEPVPHRRGEPSAGRAGAPNQFHQAPNHLHRAPHHPHQAPHQLQVAPHNSASGPTLRSSPAPIPQVRTSLQPQGRGTNLPSAQLSTSQQLLSMPGYYTGKPHTFKDAFANSRSPTPGRRESMQIYNAQPVPTNPTATHPPYSNYSSQDPRNAKNQAQEAAYQNAHTSQMDQCPQGNTQNHQSYPQYSKNGYASFETERGSNQNSYSPSPNASQFVQHFCPTNVSQSQPRAQVTAKREYYRPPDGRHSSENIVSNKNNSMPQAFRNSHVHAAERHSDFFQKESNDIRPVGRPLYPPPAGHSTPTDSLTRLKRPQEPLPAPKGSLNHWDQQTTNMEQKINTGTGNPDSIKNSNSRIKKGKKSLLDLFKKRSKEINCSDSDENKEKDHTSTATSSGIRNEVNATANPTKSKSLLSASHMINNTIIRHSPPMSNYESSPIGQPLGIPILSYAPGLSKGQIVSESHDNITVHGSRSAFLDDLSGPSVINRSRSNENISRRPRKQQPVRSATTSKVALDVTSSEDEKRSTSSRSFSGSYNSLNRTGSQTKKSRAARTERYLRRKSSELETLKTETERDKKNKELVRARVQEVHKNRLQMASSPNPDRTTWTPTLLYQDSSRFGSVYSAAPQKSANTLSPAMHPTLGSSQSVNYPNAYRVNNPVFVGNFEINNSMTELARPSAVNRDLKSNRSASYDCNINTTAQVVPRVLRPQVTPPRPPPRDSSRIYNSSERPSSYSFENESLSGSSISLNKGKFTTASQGIRAVLSQNRASSSNSSVPHSPSYRSLTENRNISSNSSEKSPALPPLPASLAGKSNSNDQSSSLNSSLDYSRSTNSSRNKMLHIPSDLTSSSLKLVVPGTETGLSKHDSKSLPTRRVSSFSSHTQPNNLNLKLAIPSAETDMIDSVDSYGTLEKTKQELKSVLAQEKCLQEKKGAVQKKLEEAFLKEKRRLEKERSANFEEALRDIEGSYNKSKVYESDSSEHSLAETRTGVDPGYIISSNTNPSLVQDEHKKSEGTAKVDDMHLRRCKQNSDYLPVEDLAKTLSGSYLSLPHVDLAPYNNATKCSHGPKASDTPDVVYDDALRRFIKRANSLKVIDPQPRFGIPLGPTTQASPNNYLDIETRDRSTPIEEPDPSIDDLAFRNLRKDQHANSSFEDEMFESEEQMLYNRPCRSHSADRARTMRNDSVLSKGLSTRTSRLQTPRNIKYNNGLKKIKSETKTCESDAPFDDVTSTKASTQPEIRSAIIREAKAPTGGPEEVFDVPLVDTSHRGVGAPEYDNSLTAPGLVKIQTLSNCASSEGFLTKTLFKPMEIEHKLEPVNIKELETLISTIASSSEGFRNTESCFDKLEHDPQASKNSETNFENDVTLDYSKNYAAKGAKQSIMNAIRLSMAEGSAASEGKHVLCSQNSQTTLPCCSSDPLNFSSSPYCSIVNTHFPCSKSHDSSNLISNSSDSLGNVTGTSSSLLGSENLKSSTINSKVSSTNVIYPYCMNPLSIGSKDNVPLPQAAEASKCIKKLKIMLVSSEAVSPKAFRARSLPNTAPGQAIFRRKSDISRDLVDTMSTGKSLQVHDVLGKKASLSSTCNLPNYSNFDNKLTGSSPTLSLLVGSNCVDENLENKEIQEESASDEDNLENISLISHEQNQISESESKYEGTVDTKADYGVSMSAGEYYDFNCHQEMDSHNGVETYFENPRSAVEQTNNRLHNLLLPFTKTVFPTNSSPSFYKHELTCVSGLHVDVSVNDPGSLVDFSPFPTHQNLKSQVYTKRHGSEESTDALESGLGMSETGTSSVVSLFNSDSDISNSGHGSTEDLSGKFVEDNSYNVPEIGVKLNKAFVNMTNFDFMEPELLSIAEPPMQNAAVSMPGVENLQTNRVELLPFDVRQSSLVKCSQHTSLENEVLINTNLLRFPVCTETDRQCPIQIEEECLIHSDTDVDNDITIACDEEIRYVTSSDLPEPLNLTCCGGDETCAAEPVATGAGMNTTDSETAPTANDTVMKDAQESSTLSPMPLSDKTTAKTEDSTDQSRTGEASRTSGSGLPTALDIVRSVCVQTLPQLDCFYFIFGLCYLLASIVWMLAQPK